MNTQDNQRVSNRPPNYNLWVGVFIILALIATGLFYYATQKIEYNWRWSRVPIYFAYEDTIEIVSEIEGDVASITKKGEDAVVTVKGIDGAESYTVPADGLIVDDGEVISLGDTLATYTEWQPGLLVIGLWITLKISIIATIAGIIIGIIGGIARLSSNPTLKWTTIVYVEIIRGSPLMVQILIWYFVFGTVINDLLAANGLGRLPAFWYGAASLACFAGAYVTEIVRAGIQSIHKGQTEAARSLGMSYAQSMRYIILPQALRLVIPAIVGQCIGIFKDTSLVAIVGLFDLLRIAQVVVAQPDWIGLQQETYAFVAFVYWIFAFAMSRASQRLERNLGVGKY